MLVNKTVCYAENSYAEIVALSADTTGSICIQWLYLHNEEITLLVTQSNSKDCESKFYSLRKTISLFTHIEILQHH